MAEVLRKANPNWRQHIPDHKTGCKVRLKFRLREKSRKMREALGITKKPKAQEHIQPKFELYSYQIMAAKYHLEHRYSLNCSEMGTGKSAMALEAARLSRKKVAVFGPAFLERTWVHEAFRMGVEIVYYSYSSLYKHPIDTLKGFDFWIADECHYLKSPGAKRTEAFFDRFVATKPKYFVGLTGTPIKNRVPDFWTLLYMCSKCPEDTNGHRLSGKIKSYYGFSEYFCHFTETFIYGNRVRKFVGIKEDKIVDLKSILRGKFIKFKVEDVLGDLPSITRKHVDLGMAPTKGMLKAFQEYEKGPKADIKAKATSALLKAPKTASYCLDIIAEGAVPILIFTDHIESAKALKSSITNSALCTGAVPAEERMQMVSDFQAGKYDAIIATIGSLSVGVTLTAARHVVFNDISWSGSDNQQAEKRIHRIGQKLPCFAHYIHGSQTDVHIYALVKEKQETVEKVL